ncbi:hypothetical protein GPALN_003054 [Globodera pallida]|nr:hypothetical protein GPALN_003054 [Globodera pallida]
MNGIDMHDLALGPSPGSTGRSHVHAGNAISARRRRFPPAALTVCTLSPLSLSHVRHVLHVHMTTTTRPCLYSLHSPPTQPLLVSRVQLEPHDPLGLWTSS